MLGVLLVIVLVIGGVKGHRYGADIQACDSMKPGHAGTFRRRTATPYIIETNQGGYVPCQRQVIPGQQMQCGVIVKLRARRGARIQQFKGFLLQARSRNVNGQIMNVGEFRYMNDQPILAGSAARTNLVRTNMLSPAAGLMGGRVGRQVLPGQQFPIQRFGNQFGTMNMNVVVQRLNCPRGFSVTHTENNPKNQIMLKWYPPLGYNQPVQFVATVVRDFNTYWQNHRSRTLRPNRRPMASANVARLDRWFSSATRATSGVVILIASLSSLLFLLL